MLPDTLPNDCLCQTTIVHNKYNINSLQSRQQSNWAHFGLLSDQYLLRKNAAENYDCTLLPLWTCLLKSWQILCLINFIWTKWQRHSGKRVQTQFSATYLCNKYWWNRVQNVFNWFALLIEDCWFCIFNEQFWLKLSKDYAGQHIWYHFTVKYGLNQNWLT